MSGIAELSAIDLAAAIAAGQVGAVEATQTYLDAIEKREPRIDAFNEVLAERAMDTARSIDTRRQNARPLGPLGGVPVAVKDNLCTTDGKTTCSSRILADFQAPYTATAVQKLEDAGAVILGKTNLDEFAMGSSTENSGFKVTRNPWDTDRVPGGSSGGSAACVAAGEAAAALGSDTGGSIRQPAAFCGVVGFKPTYGRVSRLGLVAYGSSLDQIGPLTVDVPDAALLTGVIAGHDPGDSTSVAKDVPDYLGQLETPIENLRIGLPVEFYSNALEAEINAAIHKAADIYKAAGATILDVSLPHSRIDCDAHGNLSSYAVACYYIVAMAEASSNLARYDGVHYGHRTAEKVDDIIDLYSRSRAEGFGQEVKRRIMLGTYTLSSGYYDAYYNKALKVRRLIKNDFDKAFEQCDVLLCPVGPTTAFKIGEKTDDPLTMYLADIYTISVNLAGLPALALPAGLSESNLPIGMQLIGPVFSEDRILRAARMYEKASDITRFRSEMARA
ncbi:MAG: Asp-tRNA(Asn)/Glu-tRNA(Gln) amidotransferase subunit GatA [Phycisphaerae bacterium]|jgi:aspartyl-tRNA(Asn)/glutamyl-tRNA(Gln) amidotransferase subunit A|nr:Asp-tRNA(Asn)/Glu-tRNA(Gln) amidotransferase subunit GatA [Phycisphaerae bacterium]